MIVAISQARMSSTRLPGKVLMDLKGKPLLQHHIDRIRLAIEPDKRVIATGLSASDDNIADHCLKQNVDVFRGSDLDVLDRYYEAAKQFKASVVVRLTCDCPYINPYIVDQVIRAHLWSGADYTSNTLRRTFPKGLDVEVFDFKTLEKAWKEAVDPYDREHVTSYIYKSGKFKLQNFAQKEDQSHIRLCVDTKEDLDGLNQ